MPEYFDSSEDLLASGGWLAAHKKSQATIKRNPVSERSKSLSGNAPAKPHECNPARGSQSWTYLLFTKR